MTSATLARIGPSESQAVADAAARPARPPKVYRELHDALAWFREMWQSSIVAVDHLHEGWSSVEPGDQLGGVAWHRRFVRFLVVGAEHYDPVRMAWARMRYSGGLEDRTGATFLFILACRDQDLRATGLAMLGHCVCSRVHLPDCACTDPDRGRHQHGACPAPSQPLFEEYVAWYAERAIARLRWFIENPPDARELERPAWMDKVGFPSRAREAPPG